VLGSFNKVDSARALALQRMAYGDIGVVVVDQATGEQVFPRADADPRQETSRSHFRMRAVEEPDHAAKKKKQNG
jgi:hypothetical protein